MNLAIDTDALIKLTKSSSKSAVGKAFTVLVPPEVERECVEQGKAGGFPDALRVEENVERGVLTVRKRSEEHTSELQSRPHLVCRLLLEKKKKNKVGRVSGIGAGVWCR